jgi:Methyltransferase domain
MQAREMTDAVQTEICRRIDAALATGRVADPTGYDALARVKLPGPDYLAVLRRIHDVLRPRLYVEIGVRNGDSMRQAGPETDCVGIDPAVAWHVETVSRCRQFFRLTSDEAFANPDIRAYLWEFDLAFIDGDHTYAQARRDFENLAALARPGSVILLHDVIPMDERTATPVCRTGFWTGDVWRLMREIVHAANVWARDGVFSAFTIPCAPSGLGMAVCPGIPVGIPQEAPPPQFPYEWRDVAVGLNVVDLPVALELLRTAAAPRLIEETA